MIETANYGYPSRESEAAIFTRREPVLHGDPQPKGPLSAQQAQQFNDNGFLFLPSLFSAAEVALLREEMEKVRDDFAGAGHPEAITERDNGAVRSVFNVHRLNELFGRLARDQRLLKIAEQIVGGETYIHQSRINYKPGLVGKEFYWHSDFETWHIEDGMPAMRAVSCSISLTDNNAFNGALMLIPGSHHFFISCVGETPDNHYQTSLKKQEYGVPDAVSLNFLVEKNGIEMPTGPAGSVVFFDCNTMHGSNSNISPYARSNVFMVYNHIDNQLQAPQYGLTARPEHVAARQDIRPLTPLAHWKK